jgi:hypothetical protein
MTGATHVPHNAPTDFSGAQWQDLLPSTSREH